MTIALKFGHNLGKGRVVYADGILIELQSDKDKFLLNLCSLVQQLCMNTILLLINFEIAQSLSIQSNTQEILAGLTLINNTLTQKKLK